MISRGLYTGPGNMVIDRYADAIQERYRGARLLAKDWSLARA